MSIRTFFIATFFILSVSSTSFGQKTNHGLVKWLSLEEAEKQAKKNPKPILIDVYTDWCGWCKKMIASTYSDPQVANYINANFYPVAYNAETRDTITYQGIKYYNKEKLPRGTHELSAKLLNNKLSYPTTILMTGDFQNTTLVPGYLDAQTIAPILVYYKEKLFNQVNINEYIAYFDSTFVKKPVLKKEVKWYGMQEALELNKKSPKKILVHLEENDCVICKVMDSTTYRHPIVADYLNKNFYPVRFHAASRDTIEILNQKLVNTGQYHQLTLAALKDKLEFPALLFFNERNELIMPVPSYFTPKSLEPVLHYFKNDVFMQKPFPEFMKEFKGSVR
jgi:thioredoxin-related protein